MALLCKIIASILSLAVICAAIPTGQNLTTTSTLPYGAVINTCAIPGKVALTFDDGPFIYTERLLDILRANGARVTFFVNGEAVGNIQAYAGSVQRAMAEEHQIGSHT